MRDSCAPPVRIPARAQAGAALQESAQQLLSDPAALYERLAAWRSLEGDDEPNGNIEDKEAIESFVDAVFTVYTTDNASYRPLPAREDKGRVANDASGVRWTPLEVPWLTLPSLRLTRGTIVHRGPLAGGHLKLVRHRANVARMRAHSQMAAQQTTPLAFAAESIRVALVPACWA